MVGQVINMGDKCQVFSRHTAGIRYLYKGECLCSPYGSYSPEYQDPDQESDLLPGPTCGLVDRTPFSNPDLGIGWMEMGLKVVQMLMC